MAGQTGVRRENLRACDGAARVPGRADGACGRPPDLGPGANSQWRRAVRRSRPEPGRRLWSEPPAAASERHRAGAGVCRGHLDCLAGDPARGPGSAAAPAEGGEPDKLGAGAQRADWVCQSHVPFHRRRNGERDRSGVFSVAGAPSGHRTGRAPGPGRGARRGRQSPRARILERRGVRREPDL